MTREELVSSREYQVTSEATERFYNLKNDEENNFITGFEQGAEWDKEIMIDRACEWLKVFLNTHYVMRYSDSCEIAHDIILEEFRGALKEL